MKEKQDHAGVSLGNMKDTKELRPLAASKADVLSRMQQHRLVAVVRSKHAEEAYALARAAADAGIGFIEITLTVPGALGVIEKLASLKASYVGAGTVLSKDQARQAIGSGACFIVSPTLELDLVPLCCDAGVACFPGAATPTEILSAARAGADLVKVFPADLVGGVDFIRQMRGPFPEVRFMVSGGVNKQNVQVYARADVTGICLGSAFLDNLLAQQGVNGFIREIKEFVELVAEVQAR
jgi:2-dehydro-3-deoxyphosphogluconate aldolase/(4S)-4-hydroxy-2-oxoglutarate aldolase